MLPEHFDKLRQQHLRRKSAHKWVPDAAGDSNGVARATNLGRPASTLAEQKLVRAALPTRSVPARCCLSTGTEESSSRAPRRATRAAQSAMRTQEGVRAEARTMELRAVAQLGRAAARSPTPPCRRPAAAPAAPAAPCAPPYGRSNSAVAPQSRRRASDIALWRRACASPTLSMRALPARTPCGRHLNPSSEPAGGSLLPPPPPAARGAAAPSFRAGALSLRSHPAAEWTPF